MSSETSTEAQLIGAVTGGYRVLSQIGLGTMGHVYEAEDVESGTHVALKVLRKSHQKDLAARFLREGKTLALLTHPNIVQLVNMGQLDDGTLFLATELVSGGSLRTLMDRGPLDHRRALAIVRQLLDALQAAHDLGIVHRDIKPENVMVAENDAVKVLDFGVAKLLADTVAGLGEANLTSVGFSVFGSALYIAPESVTGQRVDARIDIYSTGAMLFEMVAGRPPFDDEDPAVIMRNHAFDAPPTLQQAAPNQTFAPEIESLVARALAKQPDDRYRSAEDMIAAVDAAIEALERTTREAAKAIDDRKIASIATPLPPKGSDLNQRRARTDVVRVPQRRKIATVTACGVLVLALVLVFAMRGRWSSASADARGSSNGATGLLNGTPQTSPEQAAEYLKLGHAKFAQGAALRALGSYERALRAAPALGKDAQLRSNLSKVLEGKDALASILALELLASLTPPARDSIIEYASNGKVYDARQRAVMLAEREGVEARIDHVQSWMLDLQQATACEDRKATIELLADSADRRALTALKRARTVKCLEQAATDAIARLESATK